MLQFPIDRDLAAKAYRLAKKGMLGKEISVKLGQGLTTTDANILASVGMADWREDSAILTEREKDVLVALAQITRLRRRDGEVSSPKAKHLAWRLRLSEGQVRTALKRLTVIDRHRNVGLFGFVEHSLNGHVWMKPEGWAMVHAIEAARSGVSPGVGGDD